MNPDSRSKYLIRISMHSSEEAHQMKDWLLRHSLHAGAQSATSDGYELQCDRHEHERMDCETELDCVRQDEEGGEDEDKEENREPEGLVVNDRCLACTQCNFCVNIDQAVVLVEPGWSQLLGDEDCDLLATWNPHVNANGVEQWGVRCSCHGRQFCGPTCLAAHKAGKEPEGPTTAVKDCRKFQKEREARDLVLLFALELEMSEVLRTTSLPHNVPPETRLTRNFMRELEASDWHEKQDVIDAASRVSAMIDKKCREKMDTLPLEGISGAGTFLDQAGRSPTSQEGG